MASLRVCSTQSISWKQLPAPYSEYNTAEKSATAASKSGQNFRKNRVGSRTCEIMSSDPVVAIRSCEPRTSSITTLPKSVCSYDFQHFVVPDNVSSAQFPSALIYTDMRQVSSVVRSQLHLNSDIIPSIDLQSPDPEELPSPSSSGISPSFSKSSSPSKAPPEFSPIITMMMFAIGDEVPRGPPIQPPNSYLIPPPGVPMPTPPPQSMPKLPPDAAPSIPIPNVQIRPPGEAPLPPPVTPPQTPSPGPSGVPGPAPPLFPGNMPAPSPDTSPGPGKPPWPSHAWRRSWRSLQLSWSRHPFVTESVFAP
ncbi:uncharacterized protein [Physcomitrium patens]|uniref:Uncharacterized protein n=1 Tax=Physcomitrium patens TaxID=3218 RepID=A0A2K1IXT1_PHYPA|nr:formin-1-like [Physcomitrium patens]PNR34071.1 hypothetical protein PHYPA_023887 [Physcomitrium patens]|eukprot:XP_024356676.1 formin-1-like [Physcomitrella patens]